MAKVKRAPFPINGQEIAAGTRAIVDLPISVLSTHTPMTMPVQIVHGRRDGPTLFVSAAIHGDEIIGVEIIRRLLKVAALKRLRGTLITVPIVNVFGFISHSRYLPDRRDLNRSFPGSATGSLAARLAHLFVKEVLEPADYGIDLHSAATNRTNLPQLRVSDRKEETRALAEAFGAPVILHSSLRDGSLRSAAEDRGKSVIVYEGGEALRFDEFAIRAGVKGIIRVMRHLGMVDGAKSKPTAPVWSRGTTWLRAPQGGVFRAYKKIGDSVETGQPIGAISDPFGGSEVDVACQHGGLIIGRTNLPVVNQGDALFHVADVARAEATSNRIGRIEEALGADPLFDEDEII